MGGWRAGRQPWTGLCRKGGKRVEARDSVSARVSRLDEHADRKFKSPFGVTPPAGPAPARFLVTKNGEAKAVILGVEDFLQAIAKSPKSLAALQAQAKKAGTDKLTLEKIEAEIQAVRQAKRRQQSS